MNDRIKIIFEGDDSNKKKKVDLTATHKHDTPPNILKKAISFGKSIKSRGLFDNMAPEDVINRRELSCHGDDEIEPCPRRNDSKKEKGRKICGACGCGDKPRNFLNGEGYIKLYYPKLSCPLDMPGFDGYKPAKNNENRKKRVEEKLNEWYNTDKDSENRSKH